MDFDVVGPGEVAAAELESPLLEGVTFLALESRNEGVLWQARLQNQFPFHIIKEPSRAENGVLTLGLQNFESQNKK